MSESPSLTAIKQGTRRGAALRRQQCSWCDDRAALNGFAARSCGGMVTVEKLRGVEFDAVSVSSEPEPGFAKGSSKVTLASRAIMPKASF